MPDDVKDIGGKRKLLVRPLCMFPRCTGIDPTSAKCVNSKQSSPEPEATRSVRPRLSNVVNDAVLMSSSGEKLRLHLKVLSNIPVELDFFKETAREVIKICSPEKMFETTVLEDLMKLLRDEGADDAKVTGATIVLRHALKEYLSEKFLAKIGCRLHGLEELRTVVVQIVDTAADVHNSNIPKGFQQDLLELFQKYTAMKASTNTALLHTRLAPENRGPQDTTMNVQTARGGDGVRMNGQAHSTTGSSNLIQAHQRSPHPTKEATLKPLENGITNHATHRNSSNAKMDQEYMSLPTPNGIQLHTSEMPAIDNTANSASTTTNQDTLTARIANHTTHMTIRGTAGKAISQSSNPPTSPANSSHITTPTNSNSLDRERAITKRLPVSEPNPTKKAPVQPGNSAKAERAVPVYPPDKETTCWFWLNERPPCRHRYAESCKFAHELQDYVQDRHGGNPIPRGPQIHSTVPTTTLKVDSSVSKHASASVLNIKRERINSPPPTLSERTPILSMLWPPSKALRPGDQTDLCDVIISSFLRRARGRPIVTDIISGGKVRDYGFQSKAGLRTKIGGAFSGVAEDKMRLALESTLRPLVLCNRDLFPEMSDDELDGHDKSNGNGNGNSSGNGYGSGSASASESVLDGSKMTLSSSAQIVNVYKDGYASPPREYHSPPLGPTRRSSYRPKQDDFTCPYWYNGRCKHLAEDCQFAHEYTGQVSAFPRIHR